jgi:EAL and modified HD-GYP domain-containing signal transduction protein
VQRFLARQPIFNSARVVYGYELLFRSGPENRYDALQADMAAASTVDNILLFGIERLTPGFRAFLNCTREFLIREFATMLPQDRVVLEILETVPTDDEVHEACRHEKQAGYLLALDDFPERSDWKPLVAMANFIKVDRLAAGRGSKKMSFPRCTWRPSNGRARYFTPTKHPYRRKCRLRRGFT